MKIVHFSWEYPPVIYGGLGTFASEITKKQIEFDHDVTVFTLNRENTLPTSDRINGVDVDTDPRHLISASPFTSARTMSCAHGDLISHFLLMC